MSNNLLDSVTISVMRQEEEMPRPRHDSEVLPAKERLENAFWELLADRDYRKITVTDVVLSLIHI